jgi:hypothetical protein
MKVDKDKVNVLIYPIINYIASEIETYDILGWGCGRIPLDVPEMNRILEVFHIPFDHPNKFDIVLDTAKEYFQNREWKIVHNREYEPDVIIQHGPKIHLHWDMKDKRF